MILISTAEEVSEEELEENESDEEIEEEIEEDEEEMRQMLHTLQRVYNEVCSPTPPPPPVDTDSESEENEEEKKTTEERSSTLDESWLESSGSLSNSDGEVSENIMTFSRLEKARMVLEDALGLDTLLHAYNTIQVRFLGTVVARHIL